MLLIMYSYYLIQDGRREKNNESASQGINGKG